METDYSLSDNKRLGQFEVLAKIIATLRAPGGCPWDREQTHMSIRDSLLEETYEVLSAIDNNNSPSLLEELGDLLLQIMLAQRWESESCFWSACSLLQYHWLWRCIA